MRRSRHVLLLLTFLLPAAPLAAQETVPAREDAQAPVPASDPRPLLTMQDMAHGDHAGHGGAAMMDHGAEGGCGATMKPGAEGGCGAAMKHAGEGGCGAAMKHASEGGCGAAMHGDASADAHAGHGGPSGVGAVVHPPSEDGNPLVDMQSSPTGPRLDDPGIGLRDNGRRVLAYADLRSLFDDPDGRDPGREVQLHLTGHMEKFSWSFDGIPFASAEPLRLNYGERMRIVLVNDTMMQHPIHLHGLWSDLEDADGAFQVRKHTIDMPPGTRRSYRVRADALGRWAYHCHLLYHMEGGMMREVRVEERA